MFLKSLEAFKAANTIYPETVVVYRDGVSDAQ